MIVLNGLLEIGSGDSSPFVGLLGLPLLALAEFDSMLESDPSMSCKD